MTLTEFISLAKNTVLKQLDVNDSTLLELINFSLIEIHKKFPISVRENTITLYSHINNYDLPEDFIHLNAVYTEATYLKDIDGVSLNNLSTEIVELAINNENDPNSVYLPTPKTIMVSYPDDGQVLSLIYRASARKIEADEFELELEITPQYLEPLLLYVGYLYNLSYSGDINQTQDNYLIKYNMACNNLVKLGINNPDYTTNDKLMSRGFV